MQLKKQISANDVSAAELEMIENLRQELYSEERMFRLLNLLTDLTARVVANENLSLHFFADELFSQSDALAKIDSLRSRLVGSEQLTPSNDGQKIIDDHYERMVSLLEGIPIRHAHLTKE